MRGLKIISIVIGSMIFICGCQLRNSAEVANTYTAETTYNKLSGRYPYIAIASRDVPTSVTEIKNISYVSCGKRKLQLDLYLPADKQQIKGPAIIFVHGGGWRSGYRTNFTPFAIAMAERGYAAATISYRLSPEAQYPAAIQDAKAAIRWLRSNAEKYGIDGEKIAIAGGSAGGQIAALTGVTGAIDKFDPQAAKLKISSKVQAIINIDGLSDFTSEEARFYEDDPNKKLSAAGAWLGGRYAEKPDVWREASPLFYVDENTPPILFLISSEKRFSLGYKEMIQKMESKGIPYQVTQLPDTPHSFWLFDPWLQPSVEIVTQFLDQQLGKTP